MADYCTHAPDRIKSYDLSGCCKMHDDDYTEKIKSRLQADLDFKW
jgi:hypothetical protein